jgi:hypothetical protein
MDDADERPAGYFLRAVFGSDIAEADRKQLAMELADAAPIEVRTARGTGVELVAGDSLEALREDLDTKARALAGVVVRLVVALRRLYGLDHPWLELRLVGREVDLLYTFPPTAEPAAALSLPADLGRWMAPSDTFRWWFRGAWVGNNDLWRQTRQELDGQPTSAKRVLELIEGCEYPDWRPIQRFVEERVSCAAIVEALGSARTETQKWRLCYAIRRRRLPCKSALELLIGFLREDSATVRGEAANAIGSVFWAPRSSRRGAHRAAVALAQYFDDYPGDAHYSTLTALGATGDLWVRPVLERALQLPDEELRQGAERGLANLSKWGP